MYFRFPPRPPSSHLPDGEGPLSCPLLWPPHLPCGCGVESTKPNASLIEKVPAFALWLWCETELIANTIVV